MNDAKAQRDLARIQDFIRDQMLKVWWPQTKAQKTAFRALLQVGVFLALVVLSLAACSLSVGLQMLVICASGSHVC